MIVDKTPAEVLTPKADSPVPINTAWEEEKIPATMEAPRVEDLVEETTEQWMKRLQGRQICCLLEPMLVVQVRVLYLPSLRPPHHLKRMNLSLGQIN